jgi:hypothetical protein
MHLGRHWPSVHRSFSCLRHLQRRSTPHERGDLCCQVEVSATNLSLVQRSPTDCGASLCVIKKARERGDHSPRRATAPQEQTTNSAGVTFLCPEDGGSSVIRIVCSCPACYTAATIIFTEQSYFSHIIQSC